MRLNVNVQAMDMIDGDRIAAFLGFSCEAPDFSKEMRGMGLRVKGPKQAPLDVDRLWRPKLGMCFKLLKRPRYISETKNNPKSAGDWIFSELQFMRAGCYSQIRQTYSEKLPFGLMLEFSPGQCKHAVGVPALETSLSWPGFEGYLLAWIIGDKNLSIQFEQTADGLAMDCVTVNIRGTIGAWEHTWPEVFAVS